MSLPSVLWRCWLDVRKSIWSEVQMACIWSSWCHPPVISCFIKIQLGLTFLMPAYPGCPGKEAVKWVLVLFFVCMSQLYFNSILAKRQLALFGLLMPTRQLIGHSRMLLMSSPGTDPTPSDGDLVDDHTTPNYSRFETVHWASDCPGKLLHIVVIVGHQCGPLPSTRYSDDDYILTGVSSARWLKRVISRPLVHKTQDLNAKRHTTGGCGQKLTCTKDVINYGCPRSLPQKLAENVAQWHVDRLVLWHKNYSICCRINRCGFCVDTCWFCLCHLLYRLPLVANRCSHFFARPNYSCFTPCAALHFTQRSRFWQRRAMIEHGSYGAFLTVNWFWLVTDTRTGCPAVTSIRRTFSQLLAKLLFRC